MAGLLTAFITGAATQANADIAENDKIAQERDLRREQEADQLANWMKQTDYQAAIQKQQDIEKSQRDFELAKKKFNEIDLPGYQQQKQIDLETGKQLKSYENSLDMTREAAKLKLKSQADQESISQAQGLIQSLYPELGSISGGLGKTSSQSSSPSPDQLSTVSGPRVSELSKIQTQASPQVTSNIIQGPAQGTISDLYKTKALGSMLESNDFTAHIGKAIKDIADTKIAEATDRNKYIGAVEYADKGDPYKELDTYVKALGANSPTAMSPLFDPKTTGADVPSVNSVLHRQSLLDASRVIKAAGNLTRIQDTARGVDTNLSNLTSGQAAQSAISLVMARNTLASPIATTEQKKEAASQIDLTLKSLGIPKEAIDSDPDLASVFPDKVKTEYIKNTSPSSSSQYTPENIAYTAKLRGISEDEVRKRLGLK